MSAAHDSGPPPSPWPRDVWLDAIWECDTLTPSERAVAYAFARYAGAGDTTWCFWEELKRRTGIRSKTTISKVINSLINGKWLVEVENARQHYSARYRLNIPPQMFTYWTPEPRSGTAPSRARGPGAGPLDAQQSKEWTSEPVVEEAARGPDFGSRGPDSDFRGPESGPDLSNTYLQQRTPTGGHAAPRTPLRPQAPSGLGTEEDLSPLVSGNDQTNQLVSNHLPARADKSPTSPVDNPATTSHPDDPPITVPARASPARERTRRKPARKPRKGRR